ncbi:MAG: hypothetical protein KDM91_13000 [Verrucomicrobiae bacterium]|nr:hypothetical protein [Verrucomicrobiae bacterium]MCP5539332.1 hypothetical protein [Akkermansiaceae bacterium]MCP5549717.1 hypothetical protein [Akkermansiaceae bacterium]
MKKLIVILNDLEASGKSTVSRAISTYLSDHEIRHQLVTSDERDVDEHFEGEFWDMDEEIELSQIIRALDKNQAVVIDVASGLARNWADFCEAEELDTLLAEMDVEMTLVIPEHPSERCNEEIVDLVDLFSDQADYVIAHLPLEPKGSVPNKWKGSYAAKATNYLGAVCLNLPAIGDDLATALESSGLDLCGAIDQMENLPRFAEVQLTQWIEACTETLQRAEDYLIPETSDGLVGAI